jgi:hypothetical protein
MLWLQLRLMFRQTGRETVNEACIKKALARSLEIFKPKRSGVPSQDFGSITGMTPQSSLPQSRSTKGGKEIKIIRRPPIFEKSEIFACSWAIFEKNKNDFRSYFRKNFAKLSFRPNSRCTTCPLFQEMYDLDRHIRLIQNAIKAKASPLKVG